MHTVEAEFGGQTLSLETGRLAGQADGAVTVRYGDSVVLATAVMSDKPRQGADFFPLSVDYEERTYSIGRIPGGVLRREGRPPLSGVLTSRLTDRPIRPLFPDGMRNEVQIILTVLSHDAENDPDVIGIVAASAALTISDIPFEGPVGAVRVGLRDGEFVVNPTIADQKSHQDLDLVVVGTRDGVVMLEAGAREVEDSLIVRAINWGQEQLQPLIGLQDQLREATGNVPKRAPAVVSGDPAARDALEARFGSQIREAVRITDRDQHNERMQAIESEAGETLGAEFESSAIGDGLHDIEKAAVREAILNDGLRPDGRGERQLRAISADVGILPRTHGTGLFQRGETQVLSVVTLGLPRDAQRIGLSDLESLVEPKTFMHHYNMPPFASGEAGRLGTPRRREVGHGVLVEKALTAVIPDMEAFPYIIRIVSEVLSSNGSTSMASACGSALALMDAGVPLKAPVAGISIGLVAGDDGRFRVLTDIQGSEDHYGDMDFKVAGTAAGVTAIQVDIKIKRLTPEMIEAAVARARETRLEILETMRATIDGPRSEVGTYAPKLVRTQIEPDSIGSLIGPGGKTIRRLEEETEAGIDVAEDGTVTVSAPTTEGAERAIQMIRDLTGDIEIGRTLLGKVTRIFGFGAMVEIVPGKEGLVPKHEIAEEPVRMIEDVVNVGDDIMVMVVELDDRGRVNMSRRAVLQGLSPQETLATASPPPRRDGPGRGGRDGRDGRSRDFGRRGGRDRRPPRR